MGFFRSLIKWTLALAVAAIFLFFGVSKLSPILDAKTHSMFVKHFNDIIKQQVFPYELTKWSGETLRVVIGVLEVIFGSLLLCPHYTRLSAFFFIIASSVATYNLLSLHDEYVPVAALIPTSGLLFLLAGPVTEKKSTPSAKKTN